MAGRFHKGIRNIEPARASKLSTFHPQNPLESALIKAATDPAAQPHFLRLLLDSQVHIEAVGPKPRTVNGETQLQVKAIHFNGHPCIPFFTSAVRVPAGTSYHTLRTRDLFKMMQGHRFVVNPGAAYGKEFFPDEVAKLLDDSAFQPQQKLVVSDASKWVIAEPLDYPADLVAALSRFYASKPHVKRAWIAHYQNAENTEGQGSLIVALELKNASDLESLAGEGSLLVKSYAQKPKYVDFAQYRSSGPTHYFSDKQPFYTKKSPLKSLLAKLAAR